MRRSVNGRLIMTDTTEAVDPQTEEAIEETALPTLDEIRQQRDDKLKALAEGEDSTPEAEAEDIEAEEVEEEADTDEATDTEEEAEEQDETPDVLSQLDFDSKSDKEKEAILEALRPATGKAFGEQRKQLREWKERAERAEAAQKEAMTVASDSPFANWHTPEQVDETISQMEANIEQYEDELIYNQTTEYNDQLDKDVRGIEVNGQFVDVASVRKWAKEQKNNIKKLADRKTEIKKVSKMFDNEDVEIETLKQTHNMSDEESKSFEDSISDPSFAVIKSVKPEYAKDLYEVFAKAAVADRKPKTRKTPKAKNESTRVPKGANTNSKSIVSQIEKLQKIVEGKTGAPIRDRQEADRQLRRLKRK